MTVGEMLYGALKAGWGEAKVRKLNDYLARFVVLPADHLTVQTWAALKLKSEALGLTKGPGDLWIAASAKRHSLPLLTGDRGFFSALDVDAIDFRRGEI